MDGTARREAIRKTIRRGAQPITGAQLAKLYGVSRQVIVQDIALLRAQNEQILATPAGYCLSPLARGGVIDVLLCRHDTFEGMRRELETIVRFGRVIDVIIEHPVYGEFRANLMLHSLAQVEDFIETLRRNNAQPLTALTDGVHFHTVEADSAEALGSLKEALLGLSILQTAD